MKVQSAHVFSCACLCVCERVWHFIMHVYSHICKSARAVVCVGLTVSAHVYVSTHAQSPQQGQSSRLVPTVGSLTLRVCD